MFSVYMHASYKFRKALIVHPGKKYSIPKKKKTDIILTERNKPYSNMADDLIPRFRVKIILNFLHDNEIIRANLHAYKRILNRWPFSTIN